jgi:hypothetical protein
MLLSNWSGWADGLLVRNNLFHAEGIARYGHETNRGKDGSYKIAPGWGRAKEVVFAGNRYVGTHVDQPVETTPSSAPNPIDFNDWPGPQFDPQRPDNFKKFIRAHRKWMSHLMERQFAHRPPESTVERAH